MKSKRLLTMLLVVCMLVSVLSPAALAVQTGSDAWTGTREQSEVQRNPRESSLLASGRQNGLLSMREKENQPQSLPEDAGQASGGSWFARPMEGGHLGTFAEGKLPAYIQELRDAAELYDADELVAAFIVMEQKPLAERYYDIARVPAAETQALISVQDQVLRSIRKEVAACKDMEVRYQFTYLTNSLAVRVPFGALEEIAKVPGVSSVFLMPVYEPCETETVNPNTANSSVMTGVSNVWQDLGYTGTGMKIAVIDSGLDLDHPSFAAAPAANERSMTLSDVEGVLGKLNASDRLRGVTAEELYYSDKIPFAFNYVDRNLHADHSHDNEGWHGTHVAGIAAANKMEGAPVVGMAPDAQVLVMKVFGAAGGAYTDDILAALEDAMTLNVDVVNMSIGAPGGFSSMHPEIDAVYSRIAKHDMIVNVSAGNEGVSSANNMWGTNQNRTANPDNATISSPAAYVNTTVVASANNNAVMSPYFTADGEKIAYSDAQGLTAKLADLSGQPLEYVLVGGAGNTEDFDAVDVSGKIAVVSRGSINFSMKLANAEAAGAIGLVVYNNEPGKIGMTMVDENGNLMDGVSGLVPAVFVSMDAGAILVNAEPKTLTVSAEQGIVKDENGGQMSDFSSWGVTPDLRLLPDVTGIGGNVYSTADEGLYDTMSGTSMSSPQLAGISALVLQYIHEQYPGLRDTAVRTLADNLIMSTADPIISTGSGIEVSPRQQGAGLVNALEAVTSGAYLSVNGGKPKAELYDDPSREGQYSFCFNIHNVSDTDQTYTLDGSLMTEDCVSYGPDLHFMAGQDRMLDGKVTFSKSTVTVKAGSVVTVRANVTLAQSDKEWLDTYYPNGSYVEGYVYLKNADGVDLNLPFMGFYGDWTEAPVLDGGFWYDDMFWDTGYEGFPTAEEYFHIPWTRLAGNDWVLGLNPYTGDFGGRNPENYVLSPNGDGLMDGLVELYVSLLRNARNVTVTFTDAETGEIYDSRSLSYARKTMFMANYKSVVPMVYSWWYDTMYDFTDGAGRQLKNGTTVNLTVRANLDYDRHSQNNDFYTFTVPITLDTEAPALLDLTSEATAEGSFLHVTVSDNTSVAGIQLLNATGTRVLGDYSGAEKNDDGTYTVTMDVTGMGSELILVLGDYGANESSWKLTYTLDDNLPEVDDSLVYAYRVSDRSINNDTMYGWTSLDPETGDVTTYGSEYMEYYALTAAEYAGGYVFGVDAGKNLVVMTPGLWTRKVICNLGVNIIDMTFDKTTGEMFLLAKDDNKFALYTVDLLTGALTMVKNYGYIGPWTIAAGDDGTLYSIQRSSSKLYILDRDNDYKMVAVNDAEGNAVTLKSPNGKNVSPAYSQSMTCQGGKLYWAYYPTSAFYGLPALFTIDTETYSYTAVNFKTDCEFVGLLTVDNGFGDTDCDGMDCPSNRFTDLDNTAYYHAGVDFMLDMGYMNGYPNSTFRPAGSMTRGMLVTVLHRMAGEPEASAPNQFPDTGDYYFDAISWAVEQGIANGHKDGTFKPDLPVTRAEMAAFLYRFAAAMGCDVVSKHDSLASFVDAGDVDSYALPALRWAVAEGLVNGLPGGRLAPNDCALRAQVATVCYRLYRNVLGGWQLPQNQPLTGLVLNQTEGLMIPGGTMTLEASPLPWNTALPNVAWTSSDEKVATVENGVVTAHSKGEVTITAAVGDITASCQVSVITIEGTVYAYNYYNKSESYGDWISMDLSDPTGYKSLFKSPVDFMAAEYNGHDGYLYGYTEGGQFYRVDPKTGAFAALGAPVTGLTLADMAYDYSTGLMYVSTIDPNTYVASISCVNLHTGALVPMGTSGRGSSYMTLACSGDGQLYSISADGRLLRLSNLGGAYIEEETVMEGLGNLTYGQSMAYNHLDGTLLWACPEVRSLIWLDPATGNVVPLGDPTGTGLFQFFGLFSIPGKIPQLPHVAVEDLVVRDMLVMTGGQKTVDYTIYPLNATNQEVFWSTSDYTVATVSDDGTVTGRGVGEATITATMLDGGKTITRSFTVLVKESCDNLYGYVMTDMASLGGEFWSKLEDSNLRDYNFLASSYYTLYAEEYYNGKLYAYGFDAADWDANFQFIVMDAKTYAIESITDMGDTFPWVYDMTYDYATSTMYVTAGYNDSDMDLYIVDMLSGELIPLMKTEEDFMSIAADGKGNLYGMSRSVETMFGGELGETEFSDACLYRIDPENCTTELIGSTGLKSNLLASMAFDFDTGNLYWSQLFRESFMSPTVEGGLCLVDPETGKATSLGIIGAAGAQVTGLYAVADQYPQEPDSVLSKVVLLENEKVLSQGETSAIKAYAMPTSLGNQVEWSWESSDEAVATVDASGNVTALAQGSARITATAAFNGQLKSAVCDITVLSAEACFYSFSTSFNGFSKIDRKDFTHTELIATSEEAPVVAMDYVGDTIYGYDLEGNFFSTDDETFTRTYLGSHGVTVDTDMGLAFEIRDVAYNPVTEKLLALGAVVFVDDWGTMETVDGCRIYEVDLATGALTELCVVQDMVQVRGLTVDNQGTVYFYQSFQGGICTVDLTTGVYTNFAPTYSLGLNGSDHNVMSMVYEPVSNSIYVLYTGNGLFYQMVVCDLNTCATRLLGNIGQVVMDEWSGMYVGETFNGLLVKN